MNDSLQLIRDLIKILMGSGGSSGIALALIDKADLKAPFWYMFAVSIGLTILLVVLHVVVQLYEKKHVTQNTCEELDKLSGHYVDVLQVAGDVFQARYPDDVKLLSMLGRDLRNRSASMQRQGMEESLKTFRNGIQAVVSYWERTMEDGQAQDKIPEQS